MEETQIKYCFIGNVLKNISIYEFINTDLGEIIFQAKYIFRKFVDDKRILAEKVKIKFNGKYFYILINNFSNFYLIYVENLITIQNSFSILQNINAYYNKNIIENSNNINLIREVNLKEQKDISNIIFNYEKKYRKKTKNKKLKKTRKILTTKKIISETPSRTDDLLINHKILPSKNDINLILNEKKIIIPVKNNIYNINNDKNNVNLNKTNIEENNENNNDISLYYNKKNKGVTIINNKKVKFIDDNSFYYLKTKNKELNNINNLKFIGNNRSLLRSKIISLIFLILIAIIVVGSICFILITCEPL